MEKDKRRDRRKGTAKIKAKTRPSPTGARTRRARPLPPEPSIEAYRTLFEHACDGVYLQTLKGKILHVNPAGAHMLGYEPQDLAGREVRDLVTPRTRRQLSGIERNLLRRKSITLRAGNIRRDGTPIPVEVALSLVERDSEKLVVAIVRDVTARAAAEDKLHRSEALNAVLRNAIPDYMLRVRADGTVLDIAVPERETPIVPPEQFLGSNVFDLAASIPKFVEPGVIAEGREAVRLAVETQRVQTLACEPHRDGRDGRSDVFELRIVPAGDNEVLIVARDITERRRAEEALRRSEEMYRNLVKASPDPVVGTDVDLRITYASRRTAEIHGVPSEDVLIGRNVMEFIAPEDQAGARVQIAAAFEKGYLEAAEYTMLRADGSRFPAELSAAVIPGPDGRPVGAIAVVRDITQRKQAEMALRRSEERLQTLIDATQDVVLLVDTSRTVVAANEAAARSLGCTREEILGRDAAELIGPRAAKVRVEKGMEALRTARPVFFEDERNGREFLNRIYPLLDERGAPQAVAFYATDMTEVHRMERAIRESRDIADTLLNATEDLVALIDTAGCVVSVNEAMARQLGRSAESLRGACLYDLFPPETAERRREAAARVMATRGMVLLEEPRAGRFYLTRICPLFDEQGDVDRLAIYVTDLTERRNAETLREYYHRLDECLGEISARLINPDPLPEAIEDSVERACGPLGEVRPFHFRLRPDGRTLECQDRRAREEPAPTGDLAELRWLEAALRRNETVAVGSLDDLPPAEREFFRRLHAGSFVIVAIFAGRELREFIGVADPTPGRSWDPGEVRFLRGVGESIARSLERSAVDRQQSEARRDQAIGQVAKGITQGFRDQIQAITADAMMLRKADVGATERERHLLRIEESSASMANVLTRVYAVVQGLLREPHRVQPGECMERAVRTVQGRLPGGASIRVDRADDLADMQADGASLERGVFLNLLENAVEAVGEGGRIRVLLENAARIPGPGAPSGVRGGPYVHLHIADDGHGMTREVLEQACDLFFSTRHPKRGLGLWEVQGIVRRYGGWVRIDSEPGRGTDVHVYLPSEGV